MPYPPGTRLGHYVVEGFLGAGAMGELHRASDPRLGREVAIKFLHPSLALLPEFRERFETEIRAISRLSHKNICTVYDTGTYEGRPFIVMELLDGQTLESLLASGPLDVDRLLNVAIQVADALDAAHRQGVIHRDVKSANVFINKRGDAKVLDFGIARLAEGGTEGGEKSRLATGAPVGTMAFMSPEQARGEEVDARSDIFSLGVVLYEMAVGRTPYEGTVSSVVASLLSAEPVPGIRALDPSLPPELEHVIARALEKDQRTRYQTAADMLAALRGLSRDLSSAHKGARTAASKRPGAHRRRRWALLGIPVLLVAALAVWKLAGPSLSSPRPLRSMAVLPCADQDQAVGTVYICDLLAERVIASLSLVPGLTVLSFQAVEPYGGDDRGAIRLGEQLGVDAVLTTQLRTQGSNLNVSVEVTDVRNGAYVWGSYYQSPTTEAMELPERIALDAAESLQLRLSTTEREQLRIVQMYQQAQYQWSERTATSLEKAISLFNEVIESDSTFARAYVGLASSYILLHYYGSLTPAEAYPRARTAAEKALALDESLADAHASLGLVLRDYDRDWSGAEREFQRALQLDPSSVTAHQWYAEMLAMQRRFAEAEQQILQAERISSLNLAVRAVHGWILTCAGRVDDAREVLESTVARKPDDSLANWFLGQFLFSIGAYDRAAEVLEHAMVLSGRASRRIADYAAALAMGGHTDQARDLLAELRRQSEGGSNVSRYEYAIVYGALGEKDRAFEELRAALDERTWQVVNMGVDPMLGPLRDDPRFPALLRRVGLQ
jgi:non-specific serine/threonine protein kinase